MALPDFTGRTFGRWTVLHRDGKKNEAIAYLCRCQCGTERRLQASWLNTGKSASCGCVAIEKLISRNMRHGSGNRRLRRVFKGMKDRCLKPNHEYFPDYGGRGISICERWLRGDGDSSGYKCFVIDMGDRPSPAHTLERIDNDKGYSPDNCKWATRAEQMLNRRNTIKMTFNGVTKPMAVWSRELGIPWGALRQRLLRGWSDERSLTTPSLR